MTTETTIKRKEEGNDALTKPNMEEYGWCQQKTFYDLPTGWAIEGGEEAYDKAVKEYNNFHDQPEEAKT